jgi:hypothetical protein
MAAAGRANKLLFDILQEDTTHALGKRTLAEGLKPMRQSNLIVLRATNYSPTPMLLK